MKRFEKFEYLKYAYIVAEKRIYCMCIRMLFPLPHPIRRHNRSWGNIRVTGDLWRVKVSKTKQNRDTSYCVEFFASI